MKINKIVLLLLWIGLVALIIWFRQSWRETAVACLFGLVIGLGGYTIGIYRKKKAAKNEART